MKMTLAAATLLLAGTFALSAVASDERASRFERKEVEAAIAAAEVSSGELLRAVDEALDETKQDRAKREEEIRGMLDELVAALGRLRKSFDANGPWADQRAAVRLAFTQWRKLDPKLRHHWISEARDEFENVHRDLRSLGRIYQVDAPSRT